MADIVISYRREDSEDITRAIFEHLAEHYGASRVYMDVSSIPAGVDYRKHYGSTLRKSKVLLIIIGPNWNPPQQDGRNRLDDYNDSVRNEIEVALLTDIEVIPILVKHASMPNAASLPKLLSDLPWKNAVTIESGQDFPVHMRRLVNEL